LSVRYSRYAPQKYGLYESCVTFSRSCAFFLQKPSTALVVLQTFLHTYCYAHINKINMRRFIPITLFTMATLLLSSCAAIEGIFKAGMWSGIIIVVLVIAVVIWIIAKVAGGGGKD